MIGPAGSHPNSFESRRLWSLWDVIKLSIWRFVNTGIKMHNFQLVLDSLESRETPKSLATILAGLDTNSLNEKTRKNLELYIDDLRTLANEFDLPTSNMLLFAAKSDPPRTSREMNWLILAIRSEIHRKLVLYIPNERAIFYENDDILSDKAKDAFPNAYSELREAGSCYAAERYTACVFHAMRGAEIGLRALAVDVGVTFPDKPLELADWQNLIEQAESKIKEIANRRTSDKTETQKRDEDRKFYSQVAAQFRYFKDGWRVRASHARETYTGSQALNALSHAQQFFDDLAIRLAEPL